MEDGETQDNVKMLRLGEAFEGLGFEVLLDNGGSIKASVDLEDGGDEE